MKLPMMLLCTFTPTDPLLKGQGVMPLFSGVSVYRYL